MGNVKFELSEDSRQIHIGRWMHMTCNTVAACCPGAISARLGAGMVLAFAAISWSALAIAIPSLGRMMRYFVLATSFKYSMLKGASIVVACVLPFQALGFCNSACQDGRRLWILAHVASDDPSWRGRVPADANYHATVVVLRSRALAAWRRWLPTRNHQEARHNHTDLDLLH